MLYAQVVVLILVIVSNNNYMSLTILIVFIFIVFIFHDLLIVFIKREIFLLYECIRFLSSIEAKK